MEGIHLTKEQEELARKVIQGGISNKLSPFLWSGFLSSHINRSSGIL